MYHQLGQFVVPVLANRFLYDTIVLVLLSSRDCRSYYLKTFFMLIPVVGQGSYKMQMFYGGQGTMYGPTKYGSTVVVSSAGLFP
jgi:hypothetical protein